MVKLHSAAASSRHFRFHSGSSKVSPVTVKLSS